ncbi:MAG: glycosyltransferase [Cyanobacteria bacterium SBC]|nr:glycosyltransferase [Cyanobacteria bacterium SBC]
MAEGKISINLIARDNGSGLTRDTQLLAEILERVGFRVYRYPVGHSSLRHKFRRLATSAEQFISTRWRACPRYDINLFVEDVVPRWFPFARVNCLLPNQEWFRDEWKPYLDRFNCILCKTQLAREIFSPFAPTEFISFSSLDRQSIGVSPNYDRCFHLASASPRLGTKVLLELWRSRPDFPTLTVVRHAPPSPEMLANNIDYIDRFLPDDTLITYQNTNGVHVYPTQMEGFGHRLVEAMSCQAVTVTTDAPPMNEVVTSERGVLVQYATTQPHGWGIRYNVTKSALESAIEMVWGSDLATRRQLGERARQWYEENDRFFRRRIVEVLLAQVSA